ncbi:MAG: hypothetical protein H7Y33_03130 [Cytophagales bacterium]|nr:hypothetical protein [Rhizobacter sp.]
MSTPPKPPKPPNRFERALDVIARFIAPAMPWLFLALRRALVATLVAVIVAVVFFVVPQSREVLHGLGEAPLRSLQEFDEAHAKHINFWAYVFYVLTAIGLGVATWYAARLLCAVEARLATPNAMEEGDAAAGLKRATTWLPRGLGVFVLGAALGALLYASYTPRLTQLQALGLVALALAGPMLVAVGALSQKRLLTWAGVAAMLVAAVLLYVFATKWRIWAASMVCSTFPALLLWFLVTRRQMLERRGWRVDQQTAYQQRGFGEVLLTLLMFLGLSVGLLLLLALLPAAPVRGFGSGAALLLFLTAAVLLFAALHIMSRRASRNVPGLTLAAVVVVSVAVAFVGKESLGEETLSIVVQPSVDSAATAPPAAVPPRPFYVNAYGGGLRAAAFTAQLLARADDVSCGRFGEQVAAFSGVSGGSLGIATYLVARQELVQRGGWPAECSTNALVTATPLTDIVVRALVQDHLSSTVARMLTVDALHLPKWSPARGQALLDSWQSALVDSLAQAPAQPGGEKAFGKPAAFAQPLGTLTGGMKHPVAVYFNATDADSGHIVWFNNLAGGRMLPRFNQEPESVPANFTIGQAVLHSARFPIVSPAGKLGTQRLVDGGYADNSGTITLLSVMTQTPPPHGTAAQRLLNIDGNPPDKTECDKSTNTPPILTGLRALLQARSAHAALAVQQFQQATKATAVNVSLDLGKTVTDDRLGDRCEQVRRANHAPLGWYMSYAAAKTIEASVKAGTDQICAELGGVCKLESPAAGKKL